MESPSRLSRLFSAAARFVPPELRAEPPTTSLSSTPPFALLAGGTASRSGAMRGAAAFLRGFLDSALPLLALLALLSALLRFLPPRPYEEVGRWEEAQEQSVDATTTMLLAALRRLKCEPPAARPCAVPPDLCTVPPDLCTVPPDLCTVPPDLCTVPPDLCTVPPDLCTVPPDLCTVPAAPRPPPMPPPHAATPCRHPMPPPHAAATPCRLPIAPCPLRPPSSSPCSFPFRLASPALTPSLPILTPFPLPLPNVHPSNFPPMHFVLPSPLQTAEPQRQRLERGLPGLG
ncbi:unnamed protein product [Closterium sp. NIES-64]|nr:unnamed protein product [Closterium sp. NIES-64]